MHYQTLYMRQSLTGHGNAHERGENAMNDDARNKQQQEESASDEVMDILSDLDSVPGFIDTFFSGSDAPASRPGPGEAKSVEAGKNSDSLPDVTGNVGNAGDATASANASAETTGSLANIAEAAEGTGSAAEAATGAAEGAAGVAEAIGDALGAVAEGLGALIEGLGNL